MSHFNLRMLVFLLAASTLNAQEVSELPFFDDFSENYLYWNTQSVTGTDQWHISGDDGIDGGRCARFYVTSEPPETNDDWLVTEVFNTTGINDLVIEFRFLFHDEGAVPEFYYAEQFDGDIGTTIWTQINNAFWQGEWTWNTAHIEIENPGDSFVFAIRYRNEGASSKYILIDNFSIQAYDPIDYTLAGSSDHFEFYTSMPDSAGYWTRIVNPMESGHAKYRSIWERPNSNTVFPVGQKIRIYYGTYNEVTGLQNNISVWDCGTYDFQTASIYLTSPQTSAQVDYYGDLPSLAVNELSQMALEGLLDRRPEPWYSEGFGLYEMEYRPERNQLLQKLSDLGTEEPSLESIMDISQLNASGNKDLMASLFESKALLGSYFFGLYGNSDYEWWQLLKHYYIKDVDRVALRYSTEHFDYYAAEKELSYLVEMAENMEEQLILQETRFNQNIDHRVNICVYDNAVGLEINNRTDFQGLAEGADKINSSHLDIGEYGLLNHEFMHLWVNILSPFSFERIPYPGQFLNEGLAESTDQFMSDEEMLAHRYKIQDLFYHYQRKYNREPDWLEIIDNVEVGEEDGFWVDAYALGEMYWRYMHDKYPDNFWYNVKLFLQQDRNWSVFADKTTDQEGAEFIQFMKELAFVGPPLETYSVPYYENFRVDFTGWTLMRFGANDLWQTSDNSGFDDQYSAFVVDPYWLEDKEVDSWLVSPPVEVPETDFLNIQYRYQQTGQGIKPEVYYTDDFSGPTAQADWSPVNGLYWSAPEGQWDKMEFTIADPPDKLYLAFRFISTIDNVASYNIDNVEITDGAVSTQPEVITRAATEITTSTARLNGEIISNGSSAVTQSGFYWSSTNSVPGENDQVVITDCDTGMYFYNLTDLNPGSTHYFRAFAVNSEGNALGEILRFTTDQELQNLPFFDDFESSENGVPEYWTTENIDGWNYWHVINWNGISGPHCMRFEITDTDQHDWLITNPIECSNASKLKVTFDFQYSGSGPKPKLFYTNTYNGDAIQSTWTEIDYSLGSEEFTWTPVDEIIIDQPGNKIHFAFQYLSSPGNAMFCLIDNFSIQAYDPIDYTLAGSSDHFEYYTSIEGAEDFHLPLSEVLESQYLKYCGHWNTPGLEAFIDEATPTKVYYTEKENIPHVTETSPEWKAGFFDRENKSLYLSPIQTQEQIDYYNDLTGLAVHTFAGYAYKKKLYRDRDGVDDYQPGYYTEAFGLYEMGYRPDREMIISFLDDHPEKLTHDHLENLDNIQQSPERDIAVSYVEGQILLNLGYRETQAPFSSYIYIWNNYLKHFYDTTDEVRIKKYAETEHFDLYCSSRDTLYIDSMKIWLERTRQYYVDSFQMDINIRYPLIVIYDEASTVDLTNYGGFNGGGGCMNISPENFWGGFYDGYDWLLAHEFGHVFNDLMYYAFPFGFFHEGMADFSGYNAAGADHKTEYWKIAYVFNYYQQKYGREPTLEEFINNPDEGDQDFDGIDCYFFGYEFIRFIANNEGYIKLREFFNNGLDFNVFSMSYGEIESGYIAYLKYLQSIRDFTKPSLPVNEVLNFDKGGSALITSAYLHSTDQEVTDSELTYKMISMLEHGHLEKAGNPGKVITRFTEADLKANQVVYVNTDTLATEDHFDFILTDGTFKIRKTFRLSLATTSAEAAWLKDNLTWLTIYPNPIIHEAIISFNVTSVTEISLDILNVNGAQVVHVFKQRFSPGSYIYKVPVRMLSEGTYIVSLSTGSKRIVKKIVLTGR